MEDFEQKGSDRDSGRDSRRDSGRDSRRDSGRGPRNFNRGFSNPNTEKHKATCTDCGNECEVPFEPTPGRDVFCNDCFKKNRR